MEKLFSNKRTYVDKDGNELVDMCIPSLKLDSIQANSFLKLNETYNGRIDRFTYEHVSTDLDSAIDMVMYFNHIFNPFAVKEGDILYTPVIQDELYYTQSEPELPDGTVLSMNSIGEKKMTYAERVDYYSKLGLGVS